ncbi:hypothetical protein QUA20_31210, partial [Microcoleus sp. Pol7_A1]|uniref:transposase n=1 Tax=Microcoleus sp. Pol7_A1 TaxID=2818893 RepID=UPI002FD6AA4C
RMVFSDTSSGTNMIFCQLNLDAFTLERRAIPLYWSLLPKLGNSSFESQTTNLQQVLPFFSEYKVIVLGDREFCSVNLGNWLREKGVSFCLRLKKNHCMETEHLVWQRLDELGIVLLNLFTFSR